MEITVKVFGLTDAINTNTVKLNLPEEATVGDMIDELAARYGNSLKTRILNADHLEEDIHVMVGEETVGPEYPLKGKTQAFILQLIPGG